MFIVKYFTKKILMDSRNFFFIGKQVKSSKHVTILISFDLVFKVFNKLGIKELKAKIKLINLLLFLQINF